MRAFFPASRTPAARLFGGGIIAMALAIAALIGNAVTIAIAGDALANPWIPVRQQASG